ncbi:hypothetical protein [Paracraurococcus ruber]|uniref:Uncharacterized protein n=1 Tax=Paracraurococcus ruber TaxID=77675 RepID=A0ABS1D055_9PROT|nr:hypothetical protein [Paracraurococcus ruber]MBK1659856.1 hypothetical protein [Paracraurococcus ruber]TDG28955.1 hypothetical protein E2C05_19085 [Paracraurococcus ruber]
MPVRHPSLSTFKLNHDRLGPSTALARSARGQQIIDTLLSRDAVTALVGAIDAAPSRPPQPALDRHLLAAIGLDALDDEVKILIGRIIRQIVEHLGGHHVRKGVPITVASIFANGSIYELPGTTRGKVAPADRRAWAEQQVATLGGQERAT